MNKKYIAKKTNTLMKGIFTFARADELPAITQKYEAILGSSRPVDSMVCSNQPLLNGMRKQVSVAFMKHLEAHPRPVGLQVIQAAVTPGSSAEVSIAAVRKAAALFKAAKVDVIGVVKLVPVPDTVDPSGFAIAARLEVLVFGENAQQKLEAKSRKTRATPGVRRSAVQWIANDNIKAIKKAVGQIMRPTYNLQIENVFEDLPPTRDWSKPSNRNLRAFVVQMALAQLPVSKMLVLHGVAGPIFAQANAEAKLSLKAACGKSPPVIHSDGIPHFFFSELRRLGLDNINVPLVMLR